MRQQEAIIIGGGIAGLAAAETLSRTGISVQLLEARPRLGGRIHSIRGPGGIPIELGAEFIHGSKVSTWDLIHRAELDTYEVPDRHWRPRDGRLVENKNFWEVLGKVSESFPEDKPDQDLESFFKSVSDLSEADRDLVRRFVEGFHAAPVSRMGMRSFVQAESASEHDGGTHQFRFKSGYGALLEFLSRELKSAGTALLTETVVRQIRWRPGHVEAFADTPSGPQTFVAGCAIVTLPLNVLKNVGPGQLEFIPRLQGTAEAIHALEMGTVAKITVHFNRQIWPIENFGFIHSETAALPTWWAYPDALLLTGWVGGPPADELLDRGSTAMKEAAVSSLSEIFGVGQAAVRASIKDMFFHDWKQDPQTLGGYCFTPVGTADAVRALQTPVAETLFVGGEATDAEGEQGTVHGALTSGRRAAAQVLELLGLQNRRNGRLETLC
jgi:monoamine oxidase